MKPLRKIVDEYHNPKTGRMIEVLECGHHVPRKQDAFGETNAVRRRCRHCAQPKEPEHD